jgi:hypothetical protein
MKARRSTAIALVAALGLVLPHGARDEGRALAQGSCPGSVSPASLGVSHMAGFQTVTVNAPEHGCQWEVAVDVPWLDVEGGGGYGPGQFTLRWDSWDAFCGNERTGRVVVRSAGGGGGTGDRRPTGAGGGQVALVVTQASSVCSDFICTGTTGAELLQCLEFFADDSNPNQAFENLVIWLNLTCLSHNAGKTSDLRRFRDEVLARSPIGREYTALYYGHLPEAMGILAANPTLYRRAVWTLARLAPVYGALNAGKGAAIHPSDVDEVDRLLADVAAHARLDLKRTLERARRDLRDPSVHARFPVAVRPDAPALLANRFPEAAKGASRAHEIDEAYRLLLSPETIALAARGSGYVEWAQRHREEVMRLLLTDATLFGRGLAAAIRLNGIHRAIVENGRARVSTNDIETIDGFLAGVAAKASPALGRVIAQGRRDLRAPELLSHMGIDVAGSVGPATSARHASTGPVRATPLAHSRIGAPGTDFAVVFGGSGANLAGAVVTDSAGNTYVTGSTSATDLPTINALQPAFGGGDSDAFVAKLGPDGQVVFTTYLGGSGSDAGIGLTVDAAGNVYVAGRTDSANFPVANALQTTRRGTDTSDAFLVKIDPSGASLVYATYLGGTGTDIASSVAVDGAGNAYVAGLTSSTDLPTATPAQGTNAGSADAFVAKVNAAGSALVYATYLGGTGYEGATGIAVDEAGSAYLTGVTTSADLPVKGAFQAAYGGLFDAFVAKLAPGGATLAYATYLGGTGAEGASGIVVDADSNVYVTGATSSEDFPVARALQPASGGGFTDAFVAKLDATGSRLAFATYLGGDDEDRGYRLGVDGAGRVYVTGFTGSPNFPTRDAIQSAPAGDVDGFAALYNRDGSALVYATYLGGSALDTGTGLAVDGPGDLTIAGISASQDFPNARQAHTPYDAFVMRLAAVPAVRPPFVASVAGIRKPGKPFRVKIAGENFQAGIEVFIGDDATPWPSAKRRSDGTLLLKGAESRFPPGVSTRIRLVNPDGGEANTHFAP